MNVHTHTCSVTTLLAIVAAHVGLHGNNITSACTTEHTEVHVYHDCTEVVSLHVHTLQD